MPLIKNLLVSFIWYEQQLAYSADRGLVSTFCVHVNILLPCNYIPSMKTHADWFTYIEIDNATVRTQMRYQLSLYILVFKNGKINNLVSHYSDVIMGAIASQITSLTIVYSTVYSDADQRKHQSFASLAFVRGIHRGPVNSPHKWPVTRKSFPFDDVIMFENI